MLSRIGEIRYLRVLYGSDKAPIHKDQTMFSNYNLGDNFAQSDYTSNHIEGEETLTTTVNGQTVITLSWTPVIPGSITILVNDNEYSDDGNGKINYPGNAITVDYEKGTLTFANAVNGLEVGVTYDYNNMDVPVHAPDIKIRIVTCPIQAKSRKLRTLYSFDSAYDMCNDFGMTMNNEIVTYAACQIKHEIDMEIINDLYTKASSPGVTWNSLPPVGVSLVDHYAGFPNILIEAGNKMYFNTKMAMPNFYIVGELASNVLEALPQFKSNSAIDPKGPYLVGYIKEKPVYKAPNLPVDGFLCGYKGTSLFDSGYIYAPLTLAA